MLKTPGSLSATLSGAWAARPTPIPASGTLYFATDVGAFGTLLISNGVRWRALGDASTLAALGAPVTGIGAAETIVLQAQIPAGAWQTNDSILVWLTSTKSGATNPGNLSVRIGTAGTTADTPVTGLSAYAYMTAGGLAGGGLYEIKLISATSAQKMGGNLNGADSYTANGTTAAAAATVITSAALNALWVSVSIFGGATDTVSATSGRIQLITP